MNNISLSVMKSVLELKWNATSLTILYTGYHYHWLKAKNTCEAKQQRHDIDNNFISHILIFVRQLPRAGESEK